MENLKNSGIYMILNIENLKVYVGSSVNFRQRRREHFSKLRNNKHANPYLQNSFNKYGESKFKFIILERYVKRENLFIRENYYIEQKDSLNPLKGYNISIPKKDEHLEISEEFREQKRRISYEQYYGKITDEDIYLKWRENKVNPKVFSKEELDGIRKETGRKIKERYGTPLYGICQRTNKILEEFDSVEEIINKYKSRNVYMYINNPNKFFHKMAIIYKSNYNEDKDYTKKYKPKYIRKGKFKGRPVETYNPSTKEIIKVYNNKKECAKDLGTTEKYIGSVIRKEKGKGLYKGIGVRWHT